MRTGLIRDIRATGDDEPECERDDERRGRDRHGDDDACQQEWQVVEDGPEIHRLRVGVRARTVTTPPGPGSAEDYPSGKTYLTSRNFSLSASISERIEAMYASNQVLNAASPFAYAAATGVGMSGLL